MGSVKSQFCEGDRVVWDKQPDKTWHVHYRFNDEYVNIINRNRGGFTSFRVHVDEIKHVNRKEELKQAIREVLLSEEFLAAFAAAWQKTPLIHKSELDLSIEPITGSESEAYYLNKLKNGESN